MPENVSELETPNSLGESASHMVEKCLEFIKSITKVHKYSQNFS